MPDEDNKKKKFNPYLAPTEREDEPKLDEEDDENMKPASQEDQGEEEVYDDEAGGGGEDDVVLEDPADEEVYEEELVDEMTAQTPQKGTVLPAKQHKEQGPRSWSFYAFGLLMIVLACDWLSQSIGHIWFWTPRTIYITSYALRTAVMLVAAVAWHRSVFQNDTESFRSVFMWLGFISGIVLAVFRFIGEPSFWAFINMVVEPLDSTILALAVWYIVAHLTSKLKIIKQTV